jgi:hypothetical protein
MKRKTIVGALIAFAHFVSYIACISAVVANDAVGDSNSPLVSIATPVLGFPLMKLSSVLTDVLDTVGFSEEGWFRVQVALAALNSLVWASAVSLGLKFATAGRNEKPIQPPQTTTGSRAPSRV